MKILYLSQLVLPIELAWQKRVRSSYDWHQWIWRAFKDKCDSRDFLYRVDRVDRQVRILVLSPMEPGRIGPWAFKTKRIAETFLTHSSYRFQVKVNPTFRRASDKRRIALCKDDQIFDWLRRKLSDIGCEFAAVECLQKNEGIFVKDGKRGKHFSADLRGVLRVSDASLFAEGFAKGIGSAKGFGYGLLMLQPVSF